MRKSAKHNEELAKRLKYHVNDNVGQLQVDFSNQPVSLTISNEGLPDNWLGSYNHNTSEITVRPGINEENAKLTEFHEMLHHSMYGDAIEQVGDIKAKKLFGSDPYLGDASEAAANTTELGRALGLEIGQKYPGYDKFKPWMDEVVQSNPHYGKRFVWETAKLDTKRDYKRFWDALTGQYFTIPTAVAVGWGVLNNNDKNENEN